MRKLWSVGDCEVDDGEAGEDTDEDEDCGQEGGFENYEENISKKVQFRKSAASSFPQRTWTQPLLRNAQPSLVLPTAGFTQI